MDSQSIEPSGPASQPDIDNRPSCLTHDSSPSATPSPPSSHSDTSQPRPPASSRATRRVDILARRLSHHNLLEQEGPSVEKPPVATSPIPAAKPAQDFPSDQLPIQPPICSNALSDQFPPHHNPDSASLDVTSSQWMVSQWLGASLYSWPTAEPHIHQEAPLFHLTSMGPKQSIVADDNLNRRPVMPSHGTICPDRSEDVDEGIGDDMDPEPLLPPIALAELRSSRQARFSNLVNSAENGLRRRDLVYKAPRMRKRSSMKRTRDAASPNGGHSEQAVKRLRADQVA
jgi:hypothetical protein